MDYLIHLLTLVSIFLLLAVSLDLLVGYTGLLSLAHAAFFGVGAYSTGILTQNGWPASAGIVAGMVIAAALSAVIALPSLRIRDIYLLIITIAVQIVFTKVLLNWTEATGGAGGIAGIAPLTLFGHVLRGPTFLAFTVGVTAMWVYVCWKLVRSPFGRLLQAIRDDETGCLALGKNVAGAKVAIFAFAGAVAAFTGSIYAHYTSYIDPTGFDITVSILILLMVMLGGAGTLFGPALGAVILILLPEILKFMPLPPGVAAPSQQLLYGLMLVLVVFLRPQGLFGRRMHQAAA